MAGGTVTGLGCLRLVLADTAPSPPMAEKPDPDSRDRKEISGARRRPGRLVRALLCRKSSSVKRQ